MGSRSCSALSLFGHSVCPLVDASRIGSWIVVLGMVFGSVCAAAEGLESPFRSGSKRPFDAAVVIGNSDYFLLPDAPFAGEDARLVADLLLYTQGVPLDRLQLLLGASREQTIRALETAGESAGPGGTVWVYFSGHGAASPTTGERLLLGTDAPADASLFDSRGTALGEVVRLSGSGGAHVITVIDASFDGQDREGNPLIPGQRSFVPSQVVTIQEPAASTWLATSGGIPARDSVAAAHGTFTLMMVAALRGWADGELDGVRDGRLLGDEVTAFVTRTLQTAGGGDQRPRFTGASVVLHEGNLEAAGDPTALLCPVHTSGPGRASRPYSVEGRLATLRDDQVAPAEQLRQQRIRVQDEATARWATIEPLAINGATAAPEQLTAYLGIYENHIVAAGGTEEPTNAPFVADAREWLARYQSARWSPGELLAHYGYTMVALPPGRFMMGSPDHERDRREDELLHEVVLTQAFAIGRTEVTYDLWKTVMEEPWSSPPADQQQYPHTWVAWLDAVRFCNWLSILEGLSPAYAIDGETVTWDRAASGYRLPTEAEWEYAARAGSADTYPGTDARASLNRYAWSERNSNRKPHSVGGLLPNTWGLHDMAGNVSEWVWDWHGPYPDGPVTDPTGEPTGEDRVLRGGYYGSEPDCLRTAYRGRYGRTGLRIVRTIFH